MLIPQLEEYLGPDDDIPERAEPFWDLLAALDAHLQEQPDEVPSAGLLISVLFALPFQLALEEEAGDDEDPPESRTRSNTAWEVLQPLSEATRLSRKDFARARRILVAQQNFEFQPERFSEVLFCRSEEFLESPGAVHAANAGAGRRSRPHRCLARALQARAQRERGHHR